jgi:hypothetical protein
MPSGTRCALRSPTGSVPLDGVLVVYDTGFEKKGRRSLSVQR